MRLIVRFATGLALACAPALMAAISAMAPTEGRWALRSAGRPILLFELRRDPAAKGGWAGALIRPKHFDAGSDFSTFSKVEGPAVSEMVVDTVPRSDSLEVTLRDSTAELTHLIWTPSEDGGGGLKFRDAPVTAIVLVPAASGERVPDVWDKDRTYTAIPDWPDNAEMTRIFETDQAVREKWPPASPAAVAREDLARRARVKELLDAGQLRSGADFYHAAFVFQHGGSAESYLLAHTFAIIAAGRGRPDAAWIASATLDRYLQSIGQKQIYGTQYQMPQNQPATQEPYDRALVSDALRQILGVPPLAAQEEKRKEFEAMSKAGKP